MEEVRLDALIELLIALAQWLSGHSRLRIFIETAVVGPALTTLVKEVVTKVCQPWARHLGESKKKPRSSSMDLMAKKSNGTTKNDGVIS